MKGRQEKYAPLLPVILFGMAVVLVSSCGVVPKGYPPNKPFVYETNIQLQGDFSKDERKSLSSRLRNQLDDSIRIRTVGQLIREVLRNPPAYDSIHAQRSVLFMRDLLNSLGYYRDTIWFDTSLVVVPNNKHGDQFRTTVDFHVRPGKMIHIDSVAYNLNDTGSYHPNKADLQALALQSAENSVLKKGDAFSKQNISTEIDRLVTLYRNNGYLRFSREELVAVWDTLDPSLLAPTLDPFEQILQLEERRKRMENPTANIEFILKPGFNPTRLTKFYVGHTTLFPDYTGDSIAADRKVNHIDSSYSVVRYTDFFGWKFLSQYIYFKRGDLYNQQQYLKTVNRFNGLGAWRLVNIEQVTRPGSDTVDFNIFLTPASRYSFTTNLEVSGSNNALIQGNLLGLGANATLLNRNFARSANQYNLNARINTELSTKGKFIAAQQAGVSYTINFPRLIPNPSFIRASAKERAKTSLSIAYSNTDRKDYFIVNSLNLSWGYDIAWKNKSLRIVLPNIEYTVLQRRDSLSSLIDRNPSFKNIFNQGLVVSGQAGFKITGGKGKNVNLFSANFEESGLLSRLIDAKLFDSLYRFVKFDAEFVRSMNFGRNQLVTRFYSGVGIALKTRTRNSDIQMPYFRQFFPGGPNSMRAWNLRSLGPGSSLKTREEAPFRFGDFMFETNIEFRFPLAQIAGYKVTSALFSDIGNVWFIRPNDDFPGGELTSLKKFFKDLAVGVGTGLR
ncbi:MAG: hypothetical protein B7Z54_03030, partial [Sphingobacteriales bacterium 12-47-4]